MTTDQEIAATTHIHRSKLVKAGSMHWAHWLIIALSAVLTVGAWYIAKEQLRQRVSAQFNRQADQMVELVKERMELYENALWGGVAYLDTNNGDVRYDQWLSYANSLQIDQSYPGINGIGVIYNIQKDGLGNYLNRQRLQRPDYKLHPKHQQAEYWPITYIEPSAPNIQAVGLDMAFEQNRYSAIKKSRDSGQSQVTGPITLVQDAKKTPGFLFYAPFYKTGTDLTDESQRQAKIIGVVYAPFIMHRLMQGTLAQQKRQVNIRINDGADLLFQDNEINIDEAHSLFYKQVNITMYGRNWTFTITENLSFQLANKNNQPLLILIAGVIIDSMLLALFLLLSKSNRTALSLADEVTAELKVHSHELKRSNQELNDFAYIASHDLKAPLHGIGQLTIWIEEDIHDKKQTAAHLALIRKRIMRMENLLTDLLSYARVGNMEEKIQHINSHDILQIQHELVAPSSGFELELIGEFPVFNTYLVPFEMIFRNLISNAIKHHDKTQGKIAISANDGGDFYVFKVQDDGPGIAPEFHEKVFDLFKTLKPRDQVEGSGMGLSMIKKAIHTYGGSVTIESKPGQGACFIIKWPKLIDQRLDMAV